jgi:hypothetical protein
MEYFKIDRQWLRRTTHCFLFRTPPSQPKTFNFLPEWMDRRPDGISYLVRCKQTRRHGRQASQADKRPGRQFILDTRCYL